MKKILTILALAFATATVANAQIGIIGGFTSSNSSADMSNLKGELKNVSLYHAGIAYKAEIGNFFALQPALQYQVKGATLNELGESTIGDFQTKTGFVELSLGLQAGVDLLAFRPFAVFEPFIGYAVTGTENFADTDGKYTVDSVSKQLVDAKNKLEYGFGVGGGVELLDHVQISVQWFMNLGNLYNGEKLNVDPATTAASVDLKNLKNYQGIKVTLGLFF